MVASIPSFVLVLCLYFSQTTYAARNITVDNTSSAIQYQGSWGLAVFPDYDIGGSQQLIDLGNNPSAGGATASFTFTGVAIYYWSPLWPYAVDTLITVDSDPAVVVQMTAPGNSLPIGSVGPSVASQVRWSRTGLSNTQHTIVFSLASGGRYIVVDALTYTVIDPTETTPPSQPATSAPADTPSNSLPPGSSMPTQSSFSASASTESNSGMPGSSRSSPPLAGSPTQSSSGDPPSALSSSAQMAPATASTHERSRTLVVVSSSLGSLLGLAAIAALFFFLCYRRRKNEAARKLSPFLVEPIVSSSQPPPSASHSPPPSSQPPNTKSAWTDSYPSTSMSHTESRSTPALSSGSRPLSDTASIAYTTAPPPYQPRRQSQLEV